MFEGETGPVEFLGNKPNNSDETIFRSGFRLFLIIESIIKEFQSEKAF